MNPKPKIILYWCRRDFRLNDNFALSEAIKNHTQNQIPFFPIYILDDNFIKNPSINVGYFRRYFLAKILSQFSLQFPNFTIFTGKPDDIFSKLNELFEIQLYFNDGIEPYAKLRDQKITKLVTDVGGKVFSFKDQISVNENVRTGSGNIYSVYTPFKNAVIEEFMTSKVAPKVDLNNISKDINSILNFNQIIQQNSINHIQLDSTVEKLNQTIFHYIDAPDILTLPNGETIEIDTLQPRSDISSYWYFSEDEAIAKLDDFLQKDILNYKIYRDDLALDATLGGKTSRLSPALKWGLLSPRYIMAKILEKYTKEQIYADNSLLSYVNELIWREFYRYILIHNPQVLNTEFQAKYQNSILWLKGEEAINRFKLWIQGKTGYEIVDAAMMQIAQTGWMHNRARMIVASILTKNLGVDWRWGQEYFRFMLADLDEASNCGGWQWAASVGSDPKPIRIFNPYLQAENYDKNKAYREKWLPDDYDFFEPPIVEHKVARDEALLRYGLGKTSTVRDY